MYTESQISGFVKTLGYECNVLLRRDGVIVIYVFQRLSVSKQNRIIQEVALEFNLPLHKIIIA